MGQLYGDGYTVFVVHGSGFVPLTQVQVYLIGHGRATLRPTVDQKGTFNFAIDQGHLFFPGLIPAGRYHVLVTGARAGGPPPASRSCRSRHLQPAALRPPARTARHPPARHPLARAARHPQPARA